MSLNRTEVLNIARLARLHLKEEDIPAYAQHLSRILDLATQMNRVDTQHIQPMAHPLDLPQRLREDQVTEADQRALFQQIAPQVEAGLYLVPKVIE